ncbi:hypothetical protein WT60_11485 [Burkholderia sp. MSMB617WGS]|uniref:hypothetical protein n=1 Tax=Burkholderia sp. MSMB617WGS TaxID=1637831 RepID=UPI00075FE937|nr:hypothetical protein [Burkholderia sp. MSMB617WGS]AOK47396.1 hypothetical protein WT60_11485 [Burkholderia sp. MSMB617WGS]
MSTIIIRDALQGIGGAKGYIGVAAPKAQAPYFVVARVHGALDMTLAGPTGGRSGSYQVDCYASTFTDADRLADLAVDRAMSAQDQFSVGGVDELPDDYSPDTGLFRVCLEISVEF